MYRFLEAVLQICHSEGAVHVRNALRACPPEIRDRIDVVVVAGGAYVQKDSAGSVVHITSSRDFVPYLDFVGRKMAHADGTLRVIPAARGTALLDHSFRSGTYYKSLEAQIEKFIGV